MPGIFSAAVTVAVAVLVGWITGRFAVKAAVVPKQKELEQQLNSQFGLIEAYCRNAVEIWETTASSADDRDKDVGLVRFSDTVKQVADKISKESDPYAPPTRPLFHFLRLIGSQSRVFSNYLGSWKEHNLSA